MTDVQTGINECRRHAERYGAAIREWRLKNGVTQAEFARTVGRSNSHVCQWEHGILLAKLEDRMVVESVTDGAVPASLVPLGLRRPRPIRTSRSNGLLAR